MGADGAQQRGGREVLIVANVNRFQNFTDEELEVLAEAVGGWRDGAVGVEPSVFARQQDAAQRLAEELIQEQEGR